MCLSTSVSDTVRVYRLLKKKARRSPSGLIPVYKVLKLDMTGPYKNNYKYKPGVNYAKGSRVKLAVEKYDMDVDHTYAHIESHRGLHVYITRSAARGLSRQLNSIWGNSNKTKVVKLYVSPESLIAGNTITKHATFIEARL